LVGQRTQIAAGPWFGDSAHIIRLGLGYEPADKLELGLDVVSAALDAAQRDQAWSTLSTEGKGTHRP
jgi:hypothetical protein